MIQAPTEGYSEFVLYRAPYGYAVEIFIYPDDMCIASLLSSFHSGDFLTDEEDAEIDSYLIDRDDAYSTLGESVKEDIVLWLKNGLGFSEENSGKIADALYTWNLVHVKLDPIDAIVPNYQGHPSITESIPRRFVVTDTSHSDEDLLDSFDPMSAHLRRKKDPPSNPDPGGWSYS
jgi:hypothetical protein